MRTIYLALAALVLTMLAACGLPVTYNVDCGSPSGCSQAASTDTGQPPVEQNDNADVSCEELSALAATYCGEIGVESVDCSQQFFTCNQPGDSDSGGNGNSNSNSNETTVTIYVTMTAESDGSVTVTYDDGDPATADCEDGIDNDGDGFTDYPDDADCTSSSDASEADDDGGTDTGGDTGDGGCTETADGVEYCDGVDNDCNGITDDGDFDGDGWISDDCTAYDGTSIQTGDCQDGGGYVGSIHSALVHPGRSFELFNWIDEDCNGYDERGSTEAVVEYDGCALICNTDSSYPTTEYFETNGDAELECISAAVIADQSSNEDALDTIVSFVYAGVTYGGVAVTCDESVSVQGSPASWDDIDDVKDAICADTPALTTAECLALF